ncbi:MAG: M20/M25/M40 family metallo-hydrolase [Solirubrobacteraceae bacterium]
MVDPAALLADAAALVRVPSVTGRERPAAEALVATARRLGLEARVVEHDLAALRAHPDHPGEEVPRDELVTAEVLLRGTEPGAPRTCLCGHLDVVSAGSEPWARDPWSGELHAGALHGRGAADMKGAVVAALHAASRRCTPWPPPAHSAGTWSSSGWRARRTAGSAPSPPWSATRASRPASSPSPPASASAVPRPARSAGYDRWPGLYDRMIPNRVYNRLAWSTDPEEYECHSFALWPANTVRWQIDAHVERRETVSCPTGPTTPGGSARGRASAPSRARSTSSSAPCCRLPPSTARSHRSTASLRFAFPTGPFPWNPRGRIEATAPA